MGVSTPKYSCRLPRGVNSCGLFLLRGMTAVGLRNAGCARPDQYGDRDLREQVDYQQWMQRLERWPGQAAYHY